MVSVIGKFPVIAHLDLINKMRFSGFGSFHFIFYAYRY